MLQNRNFCNWSIRMDNGKTLLCDKILGKKMKSLNHWIKLLVTCFVV